MPVPQNLGLTPLTQQALQPYLDNGLTYTSQNPDIITRDPAGNYIINTDTDQLLIIDTIEARYRKRSVIRAVNTAFSYFTFPVQTDPVELELPDINIDIDFDPVYALYQPTTNITVPTSAEFSGIDMGKVLDGLPQANPNSYTISKIVKNSGVDLRFRIKINHQYGFFGAGSDTLNEDLTTGTIAFSIAKAGLNFPLNREWVPQFAPSIAGLEWSQISPGTVTDTFAEIIIENSEFEQGDSFQITANCGPAGTTNHKINANSTYWSITDASKNVDEWNQPIE
jgi:hypothetical protein